MTLGGECTSTSARRAGDTFLFQEAVEAPDVVRRQYERNAAAITKLGGHLRAHPPRAVITLARGSSDNAATFARYLIEREAGVLTSSVSPSIASIYRSMPDLTDMVALAISQSGRSPDLLTAAEQARAKGAFVVSLVNDEESPLAGLADCTIPLGGGVERSVAASKSFVASLAAIVDLLAAWTGHAALKSARASLPQDLEHAWELDWSAALSVLVGVSNMYVVGRGHGFAIAQEAALKLKETCAIHAEPFSGAEIRHGPFALLRPGFPAMLFAQKDATLKSMVELATAMNERGASVLTVGMTAGSALELPIGPADGIISPILQILSFYRLVNALALARGFDPDRPPHLSKITETH